jgi:serpin B
MRAKIAILLTTVVLASAACAGPSGAAIVKADVPRAAADPAVATDAGNAVDAFGLDLYLRLASGGHNVVFSPASIAIALGMARAGARGQTATEMDAVMRDLGTDAHAAWLNALDAALTSRTGSFPDEQGLSQPVSLRIANAPFAQRDMKLVDAYLQALAARYGAGVRLVDYRAAAEAARQEINAWVSDQTEQRIPELLAAGTITPHERLALVNAIYLKAAWLTPFSADLTKDGPFTRLDGSTVSVPLMQGGGQLPYAAGAGWQAVEIPYVGGSLAMDIIVPTDLVAFEATLTPESFARITGTFAERPVALTLSKFGIESKVELAPTLSAMGMPTVFRAGIADFSGMTTDEQLYITAVIHQANIDVDEKGTTAAAATAVVMRASAAPGEPVTLRVDHPFIFALRDVPTGTILFLGRVTDPSSKS